MVGVIWITDWRSCPPGWQRFETERGEDWAGPGKLFCRSNNLIKVLYILFMKSFQWDGWLNRCADESFSGQLELLPRWGTRWRRGWWRRATMWGSGRWESRLQWNRWDTLSQSYLTTAPINLMLWRWTSSKHKTRQHGEHFPGDEQQGIIVLDKVDEINLINLTLLQSIF